MTDPIADTWNPRDLPLLLAVYEIERSGGDRVASHQLAQATGLSELEVSLGVTALREADYITLGATVGGPTSWAAFRPRLLERGRREIGQWPQDGYAAFVAVIEARLAASTNPVETGNLEKVRDGLIGMGRDVASALLVSVLKDTWGIGRTG